MTYSHRARASAVVAAGCLLGGCGWTASGAPEPPAVVDAGGVDMCTILTDAELSALGLRPDTREPFNMVGVISCGWLGQPFRISLGRDEETVAEYAADRDNPAFTSFRENTVNDRAGVQLSVHGDRTDCAQMVDGGSVSLRIAVAPAFSLEPRPVNSCAEALRIAEMIEPRLP